MRSRGSRATVALVGPIPPFRGGIAKHTAMLRRALAELVDVETYSYTRQYPRWLYPGQSDREPRGTVEADADVHFVVDALAPSSWWRLAQRLATLQPAMLVLPWWTVYWAPAYAWLASRLRQRGVSVVFMCHNVVDHDAAWWKRWLTARILRLGDGFVCQSESERHELERLVPHAHVTVVPHPVYDQYPRSASPPQRRASLELLFFGFVRPYKGLDVLLEALAASGERDVRLSIVGEFWSGLAETEEHVRDLGLSELVEIVPRYVDDNEAAGYFERCDALVMPYLSATGSGVLGLALHYARPVIASAVSGIAEHVRDGESGHLVPAGDVAALAHVLRSIDPEALAEMRPSVRAVAAGLSWDAVARGVLAAGRVEVFGPASPSATAPRRG